MLKRRIFTFSHMPRRRVRLLQRRWLERVGLAWVGEKICFCLQNLVWGTRETPVCGSGAHEKARGGDLRIVGQRRKGEPWGGKSSLEGEGEGEDVP